MSKKINVLITAVGGAIGQGIIKAAKMSSLKCRIVTADAQPYAVGLYRGDAGYIIPLAKEDNFVDEIIKISNKESIDAIIPGTDYELPKFSENKKRIEKETNAKVLVSSPNKILIAKDKYLTQEFFRKNHLPYIKSFKYDEFDDLPDFPLLVKPRIGDSSKDTFVVKNMKELEDKLKIFSEGKSTNIYNPNSEPFIQEYIEGSEFTTSTVTFDNHCYGAISMEREMRFGGHTTKAIIENFPNINSHIRKVAEKFNATGQANFQSRLDYDTPKIFEINCRFSASTPLCAELGFNNVDRVLRHEVLGEKIGEMTHRNGTILRYFNEVVIPPKEIFKVKQYGYIKKSKSKINKIF